MFLRRLLGMGNQPERAASRRASAGETETIRRIAAQLAEVDPDQRRYLAGLAYVLGRASQADLKTTELETRKMEEIVAEIEGLSEAQAVLVVQIAKHQAELYGGTEDYLVTREFASHATPHQRIAAVAACFAVVASDHEITAEEYAELTQIAIELGLTRAELNDIRRQYSDHLTVIQHMRGERE